MELPEGDHDFKFLVDGEWRHIDALPHVACNVKEVGPGGVCNRVVVQRSDFEVFRALAEDMHPTPAPSTCNTPTATKPGTSGTHSTHSYSYTYATLRFAICNFRSPIWNFGAIHYARAIGGIYWFEIGNLEALLDLNSCCLGGYAQILLTKSPGSFRSSYKAGRVSYNALKLWANGKKLEISQVLGRPKLGFNHHKYFGFFITKFS